MLPNTDLVSDIPLQEQTVSGLEMRGICHCRRLDIQEHNSANGNDLLQRQMSAQPELKFNKYQLTLSRLSYPTWPSNTKTDRSYTYLY